MNYVRDVPTAVDVADVSAHNDIPMTSFRRRQAAPQVGGDGVTLSAQIGVENSPFSNPAIVVGTQFVLRAEAGCRLTAVLLVIVLCNFTILIAKLMSLLAILIATVLSATILCGHAARYRGTCTKQ